MYFVLKAVAFRNGFLLYIFKHSFRLSKKRLAIHQALLFYFLLIIPFGYYNPNEYEIAHYCHNAKCGCKE